VTLSLAAGLATDASALLRPLFAGFPVLAIDNGGESCPPELPSGIAACIRASAPLLASRDIRDFEARLVDVVESLRRVDVLDGAPRSDEPLTASKLDRLGADSSPMVDFLGSRQAKAFICSLQLSLACCEALRRLAQEAREETARLRTGGAPDAGRYTFLATVSDTLSATPWDLHEGKAVPSEIIEFAIGQWKGYAAGYAILAAILRRTKLEPWLSASLVQTRQEASEDQARLLAAIGYPPMDKYRGEKRIDLVVLWADAARAHEELGKTIEADIRAGRVGIPEDDD
jgi:hypothetical protein